VRLNHFINKKEMISYNVDVDVDIHVEELLHQCDSDDIDAIIEWLVESGNLPLPKSTGDTIWNEQIQKLYNARHLLTVDEEDTILNITKKLL